MGEISADAFNEWECEAWKHLDEKEQEKWGELAAGRLAAFTENHVSSAPSREERVCWETTE